MSSDNVVELLSDPRFELLPFAGYDEQVNHLPGGATVALTASPDKGLDLTVEKSLELADDEFEVIPHIAARSVRNEAHLLEITKQLLNAGISDVFVPGGDNEEPAGEFDSSFALLSAMEDHGIEFDRVGITGYPEGHHFIEEDVLWDHLRKKEPHATYIVTQLCFDPDAVIDWIDAVRERNVDLPVHVGIPGVMKYQRLLNISSRIGVGESIDFLRKTTGILGFIKQVIGSRGNFTPDRIVDGIAPYYLDSHYDIRGVHLYTFNQVPDTEAWRMHRL